MQIGKLNLQYHLRKSSVTRCLKNIEDYEKMPYIGRKVRVFEGEY